jgi:hypothetical protein
VSGRTLAFTRPETDDELPDDVVEALARPWVETLVAQFLADFSQVLRTMGKTGSEDDQRSDDEAPRLF